MQLVTLKAELADAPTADSFDLIDAPTPTCPEGGMLVRTVYLSLDPYIGSRIRGRHMGEGAPRPGHDPIPGAIVGQVLESKAAGFSKGDWIHSMEGGWQATCALDAAHARKIDANAAPLSAYTGVLGMPGLTAWAGITQLAKVRTGDTVLIDAAAGPVGGTAGQIARIKGASRIVGIAGGQQKCGMVTEQYGFDACIDYKQDGWKDALTDALPDGLSVFFENVSGEMAMTALGHAQLYTRGILCGLVAGYQNKERAMHALDMGFVIGKRAQLFGLVVYDYYDRWDVFTAEASGWIKSGELNFVEDRAEGLANAPALFEKLLGGKHIGKAIVQVTEE